MKAPEQIIELQNISLVRNGKPLLKNISWTVNAGEHWAIIGPNGAGKSILLKIIASYLCPTTGTVNVLGERYGTIELQQVREHLSWISASLEQELPGDQNVLDTVLSGHLSTLRVFTTPKKTVRSKAKKLLARFGLSGHELQLFNTLSTGEKKKTLLARALMHDPRLLILDEVCAGLDPAARLDYLNTIRKAIQHHRQLTILFVTHHIEELIPEISHILALRNGRIASKGIRTKHSLVNIFEKLFGKKAMRRPF